MGYPNFGKVKTITLPYEEDMTASQYLDRYGIDLATIELYDLINIALDDVVYPVLYADKANKVLYMADRAFSYNGGFTALNTSLIKKVTESGTLNFDLSSIVDADGNKRFIDGDIVLKPDFKGTKEYAKWTLSGSHLMIVCLFKVTEDFTAMGTDCASMQLPEWLFDKIYAMGTSNHIAVVDALYGYTPSNLNASTGAIRPYIGRDATLPGINITIERGDLEQDKYYRIVFDLVIE